MTSVCDQRLGVDMPEPAARDLIYAFGATKGRSVEGLVTQGISARLLATRKDLGMTPASWKKHQQFPECDRLRRMHAKLSPFTVDDPRATHEMSHAHGVDMQVCCDSHHQSRLHSEFIMGHEGGLLTRTDIPMEVFHCIHSRNRPSAPWKGEYLRPRADPYVIYAIHRFTLDPARGNLTACAKVKRRLDDRPHMIPFTVCGASIAERAIDQFNSLGGRVVEDECPGCRFMVMGPVRLCYYCGILVEW